MVKLIIEGTEKYKMTKIINHDLFKKYTKKIESTYWDKNERKYKKLEVNIFKNITSNNISKNELLKNYFKKFVYQTVKKKTKN